MKQIKRYGLIAGAAALVAALCFFLLFRSTPQVEFEVNLLANGDFSQVDDSGNPVSWFQDAWGGLSGTSMEVLADENGAVAHIVNLSPKDARYAQEVMVEPDSLYRLHGYIKASSQGGWGANLSVQTVNYGTLSIFDTQGEWQEATVYGRTGENQKFITVYARLGGYSGEATGEAYFRDLTLCKVNGIQEGYAAQNWATAASASSSEAGDKNASSLLVVSAMVYFALFLALCRLLRKPRKLEKESGLFSSPWTAAALLMCAFIARLFIAALNPGYNVDIGCFRAWAEKMAASGPAGFYPPEDPFSFCDYPPGYMWILWILGAFGRLFGTGVTAFMVKLPPIVADIALCGILYVYAKKRLSAPAALALTLLYALNPLIIAAGPAWGQADALMTLLLFLVVVFAVQGVWRAALPLYIAAVLMKPQALMFGPLGLAALGLDIFSSWKDGKIDRKKIRDILLGLGIMVLTALMLVLPFSIHLSWDWLITLYSKTMGRYAYATVNACNLYFLLGKNWVAASSSISGNFFLPLLVYLLSVLPLAFTGIKHKALTLQSLKAGKDRVRVLTLSGLSAGLGLSMLVLGFTGNLTYASLGTAMIVYCVALFMALYVLGRDARNLPVFGAAMLLLLYDTGSMMHERYLFPAVALLLLGYALKKDIRILWLAVGVSISGFLNVGCVLDRNIRIGGASGHLDAPVVSLKSDMAILEYLSAALNCAMGFCALWLCAELSRGGVLEIQTKVWSRSPLPEEKGCRRMTWLDWALLCAVTAVYAVVAFTNLGAIKSPQTAYASQSPDEQVILDLGSVRSFQMLYFGGIHRTQSDFTVEVSADGQQYDQYYTAGMAEGDCFKWQYLSSTPSGTYPVTLNGRYVRITADHYDLTLFETLFRDAETSASIPATVSRVLLPAEVEVIDPATGEPWINPRTGLPLVHTQIVEGDKEAASALVDEPDSMEGDYPSWYNSTYFDEIYHARTGYELLHGMQPYEWTHPPLGKVFMSWCIAIFGMTPFGWRFAGALAGVLMLPGMYLLGKLLIKRSWGGIASALLMALDLMHFTQTRIATIDSFIVLFIIWMVYFMLRWFFLDFFRTPFLKTFIPLALSGVCMGLGIASKWTGCYAGVVLAIIFFMGIWRRGRIVLAARQVPEKERTEYEAKAAKGGRYLLITVASCLILFVAVPLVIYYCSYIPFFGYDSAGITVDKVIRQAVGTYFIDGNIPVSSMLGYHSQPGLGMDHSFYSPWYEWPVIAKPMYYSSNAFEPEGYQMSIMAMGNPAVWWTGLLCVALLAGIWVKRHLQKDATLSPFVERDDPRYAVILLCYFVQLLPWILVPRGTYIYHYFPCVPFLVLSILLCLDTLADAGNGPEAAAQSGETVAFAATRIEKHVLFLVAALLAIALALFVAFFPYASGRLTPQRWMEAMRWFDRWLWY